MNFGYSQPFSFKVVRSEAKSAQQPKSIVASVRDGVTEITLNDGRVVRATLHVKSVEQNPRKPGTVDVSYNVVTEVLSPTGPLMMDAHETLQ
jgi:hypothetical protein